MNDPLIVEFGLGTSLRRGDYTQAAERAVRHALWRNSINLAELMGFPKSAMRIKVRVACVNPDAVDRSVIAAVFPYGQAEVDVVEGGLDIPRPPQPAGTEADTLRAPTVMAQASLSVYFDMERGDD